MAPWRAQIWACSTPTTAGMTPDASPSGERSRPLGEWGISRSKLDAVSTWRVLPSCKEGRDEALSELQMVPADDAERAIDREVRAHVHYWTSQAFKARGDAAVGGFTT